MNKLFYLLGAGLLLVPVVAVAADLEVTCDKSGGGIVCSSTPLNGPLFDEDDLKPGDTVIRVLRATNNHDEPCCLELDTKNEVVGTFSLADRLWAVIRGTADIFGVSDGSGAASDKTMSDVFAAGPISLGTLVANSINDYKWAVTFDETTGNDWQGTEATFDFDMVFTCEEGAVGGGDEEDCCPGPDPLGGGMVMGMLDGNGGEDAGIMGVLLERFPVAGVTWPRVIAGVLAAVLGVILAGRLVRSYSRSRCRL